MAVELKPNFVGTWIYFKSENFDEYLDKQDIGSIKKAAEKNLTPTLVTSVDVETISVLISAVPKSYKAFFKLGEEYTVEAEVGSGKTMTVDEVEAKRYFNKK